MNQDSYNLPYSQNSRSQVGAAAGFQNQSFLNKMDYKKNDYSNNSMYNIQMVANQPADYSFSGANGNGAHNGNNNNPRKGSNLWECNICHKVFKERKGFYQHINSNTHEPIKYSCSQCGKGFASLGALALHNEQASHAHLPGRGIGASGDSTVASKAPSAFPPAKTDSQSGQGLSNQSFPSDNFYPPMANANGNQFPTPSQPQFSARGTPFQAPSAATLANNNTNNLNAFGIKNQSFSRNDATSTESYYSSRNDFQGIKQHPSSSNYPSNQQPSLSQQQPFKGGVKPFMNTYLSSQEPMEDNDNRYSMYFTGLIDLGSLLGAFSWCIGDEMNGVMVTQGAVTVVDTFLSTEQLEYKGLINGLKAALSKGLKAVTIRSNSEMVISHVMGEQKSKYLETVYRSLDELKAEALALFPLFELIKFELVPIERNKYVYQIAKKNITETVGANNGSMNLGQQGVGGLMSAVGNTIQLSSSTLSSSPLSPPMPQYNHHSNHHQQQHKNNGVPSFLKNALGNSSDSISINVSGNNSLVSTPCHSNPNSFPSRYSISSATTVESNSSNTMLSAYGGGNKAGGNNSTRSNTGSINSDYSSFSHLPGLLSNNGNSNNNGNNSNASLMSSNHNNNNNMMMSNLLLSSSHHDHGSEFTNSDQHSEYNNQHQQHHQLQYDHQQQLKDQRDEQLLSFSAHSSLMDEMKF